MATDFLKPKKLSANIKSKTNGFNVKDVNTITSLNKVLSVATDKKSVANSKLLLDFLSSCIDNLPTGKINHKQVNDVKSTIKKFNELKNSLENFLDPLYKIMEIDVILDAQDVCKIMDNLNKCIVQSGYISDYLTTAVEIYDLKLSLKKQKPVSLEEVHKFLAA